MVCFGCRRRRIETLLFVELNDDSQTDQNILFITYEEMKSDLKSVIAKVSTFLGKGDLDDARMEALMTHLSFDKMKDNKAVNKAEVVQVSHCTFLFIVIGAIFHKVYVKYVMINIIFTH